MATGPLIRDDKKNGGRSSGSQPTAAAPPAPEGSEKEKKSPAEWVRHEDAQPGSVVPRPEAGTRDRRWEDRRDDWCWFAEKAK